MSAEPTSVEVVAWLERTGATLGEAVANFWPTVTDEDMQETLYERVKKWRQAWRKRGGPAERPARPRLALVASTPEPEVATEPVPAVDLGAMTSRERLQWQMAQLSTLHAEAMQRRDVRAVTLLSQQIREVGAELDTAKLAEGVTVPLEPIPAQVAKDIVEESKHIRLLVEALQALQAEQPTKEE